MYRLIDQELLQSLLSSSSVSTCAFSGLRPIPDQTRGHTDTHSSASIHTLQSRYSHRSTGHMTARCQAGICRGGRRVKPSECRTVEVQTPLFILPWTLQNSSSTTTYLFAKVELIFTQMCLEKALNQELIFSFVSFISWRENIIFTHLNFFNEMGETIHFF